MAAAMRRWARPLAMLVAGLALAGCLPVPQVVPARLGLRYLGPEPTRVDMNCANTGEFMFIEGPDEVRLRVSPKSFPERRQAVLQMTLVALGPRQALLETQQVAMTAAASGVVRQVAIVSSMRAPAKFHDFDVRIDEMPDGAFRIGLPVVRIGTDTWRPAELELEPVAPGLRPMPFNC